MNINDWTGDDSQQAMAEGWDIFEAHGDKIELQIQRIDETAILEDDGHAWKLCAHRARAGSELHRKALTIIRDSSPDEWERIRGVCGKINL